MVRMSLLDSARVLGAMARVTAPTLVDAVRGSVSRRAIDDRTRWFGRRVVEVLDIDLITTGADAIPPGRAYVYMANHQSHLDIPVLYATLPSPTIRMVGKAELFRIPLWGRAARAAEYIEIDRADHAKAMASMAAAGRLIADGVSVFIAPEGTRSRDGRLGPLKKGGFHLALGAHVPVVPVAIRGTIDILPRGASAPRRGRRVEVTIGAPISTEGRDVAGLMAEVRAFLVAHVDAGSQAPGRLAR